MGCARARTRSRHGSVPTAERAVYAILLQWALNGGVQQRVSSRLAHAEVLQPYLRKQIFVSQSGVDCDDFILRVALEQDALILSNDLYRDHIARGVVERQWVQARRLPFMFVNGVLLVHGEQPRRSSSAAAAATIPKVEEAPADGGAASRVSSTASSSTTASSSADKAAAYAANHVTTARGRGPERAPDGCASYRRPLGTVAFVTAWHLPRIRRAPPLIRPPLMTPPRHHCAWPRARARARRLALLTAALLKRRRSSQRGRYM